VWWEDWGRYLILSRFQKRTPGKILGFAEIIKKSLTAKYHFEINHEISHEPTALIPVEK
jgi:hypothetical protein